MPEQVLIISSHPLFRDGITSGPLGSDAEVIAAAATWQDVEALGLEQPPDVIVVDHQRADLQETDLTPLLWPDADDLRVIYVTLAGDRMTVHQRHQVSGATKQICCEQSKASETRPAD